MPGDNAAMDVELIAECDGGEAAVCDPRGWQDRGRRRGGLDHGIRQDRGTRLRSFPRYGRA